MQPLCGNVASITEILHHIKNVLQLSLCRPVNKMSLSRGQNYFSVRMQIVIPVHLFSFPQLHRRLKANLSVIQSVKVRPVFGSKKWVNFGLLFGFHGGL